MIGLTKTGQLFLGVLVLFYVASLTSQSTLLLSLIGILIGCYVINLLAARRVVHQLAIHPPPSAHLVEGEKMTQPWKITNAGCQPGGLITLHSTAGTLFRIASLDLGETVNLVPDLVFQQRGVYALGEVKITSIHPFGFVRVTRSLNLPGEVVVCPSVYAAEAPHAASYDVMVGGKLKGNRRTNSGSQFAGIRPHQAGDPLKHIHWKSSSKGHGLMVKTFDEELSGRISIIMDCGSKADRETLDDCVRAAGSLVFAALDAGHHVEWIDLNELELMLIPPFADGHEILDQLARVEAGSAPINQPRLHAATEKISRKSAISLVLTEFNPAVLETVARLLENHRSVSVYLPAKREVPPDLGEVKVFQYSRDSISERR